MIIRTSNPCTAESFLHTRFLSRPVAAVHVRALSFRGASNRRTGQEINSWTDCESGKRPDQRTYKRNDCLNRSPAGRLLDESAWYENDRELAVDSARSRDMRDRLALGRKRISRSDIGIASRQMLQRFVKNEMLSSRVYNLLKWRRDDSVGLPPPNDEGIVVARLAVEFPRQHAIWTNVMTELRLRLGVTFSPRSILDISSGSNCPAPTVAFIDTFAQAEVNNRSDDNPKGILGTEMINLSTEMGTKRLEGIASGITSDGTTEDVDSRTDSPTRAAAKVTVVLDNLQACRLIERAMRDAKLIEHMSLTIDNHRRPTSKRYTAGAEDIDITSDSASDTHENNSSDTIPTPAPTELSQRQKYELQYVPRLAAASSDQDIVCCNFQLSECADSNAMFALLRAAWQRVSSGGILMIVEGGSPQSFELLARARKFILREMDKREQKSNWSSSEEQNEYPSVNGGCLQKNREYSDENLQNLGENGDSANAPITIASAEQNLNSERRSQSRSGHIVAPCPHDGECPLYNGQKLDRRRWCHFSQRFVKPAFLRHRALAPKKEEDAKYSYCIFRKDICRPSLSEDSSSLIQLQHSDGRRSNENIEQPLLAAHTYSWPRIILPPIKQHKHVQMEVCAANGKIERYVYAKSQGSEEYRAARKAHWGDLIPVAPKAVTRSGRMQDRAEKNVKGEIQPPFFNKGSLNKPKPKRSCDPSKG